MSTNAEILYVKDHIFEIEQLSFSEAIHKFSNVDLLLVALLNSLGNFDISKEAGNSACVYFTMNEGGRKDLLTFDSSSHNLLGVAVPELEAAFNLVKKIEGVLSDAMYFPPDLRKKTISAIISDLGITEKFYSTVLSNWKAYR